MMNISFCQTDPLNTVIVNSADDIALFQTETHGLVDKTTTVNRIIPKVEDFQESTKINWGTLTFNLPQVHYRGRELRTSEF